MYVSKLIVTLLTLRQTFDKAFFFLCFKVGIWPLSQIDIVALTCCSLERAKKSSGFFLVFYYCRYSLLKVDTEKVIEL